MLQHEAAGCSPEPERRAHLQAMSHEPLLSILVATRNRQPYAFELVKDVLSWADDRVELVVEDNSDDDSLAGLLLPFSADHRLRYRHNASAISSIDNFNHAIEASRGRFVCLIGDDDGMHSGAIEAVAWAEREGIDCLQGGVAHEYIWPTGPAQGVGRSGALTFPEFRGRVATRTGPSDLEPLLARGGTQYLELGLPRLYHGFVRRSILSRMQQKRGYYLGGLSPDIYAAVSLSQLAAKVVSVDYPLTIPGVCTSSTTATEGKARGFSTNIRDAPHFRSREWYRFREALPPFYCVDAIWADSACAALSDLGQQELCGRLNVFRLAAYIARHQPRLKDALLDWLVDTGHARSRRAAQAKVLRGYLGPPLAADAGRAVRKLARLSGLGGMKKAQGLASITAARLVLEESVRHLQMPWAAQSDSQRTRSRQ